MKNFFQKIDLLSPTITLYFKGETQHPSIPSAILSIIAYALVLAATIYYFLGFINKDSPKAYFFTRYIEDAGYFPVNASSMFNYIQFIDKFDSSKLGFDFQVLRAVGVNRIYYEQYMDNPNVIHEDNDDYNYWVYGPCNYDSDIQGIEDLIDRTIYDNAACIREYYDKKKKRYFKTGESGFVWPVVEKGCSNPKSSFYGLIVQRCDRAPAGLKNRDYLPSTCKSSSEIDNAISLLSFKYQIIDHFADMLNYEMPFIKYFYEVSSAVSNGIFIVNHLNFNPADMLTHNGFFFDNQVREPAYFFTQNEKHTMDEAVMENNRTTNGCLIGVYFWMQNTLQHYERTYDRFQDFLSDVGGIASIITTIGYYLNLLINYYVTLLDTEELIINRDEANYGENRKFNKRPTFIRKVNQLDYPPKKQPNRSSSRSLSMSNNKKKDDYDPNEYKDDDIDIYTNKKLPKNKDNRIDNEKNQEVMEIENMNNSSTFKTLKVNKVDSYIRKENRQKEKENTKQNDNTYVEEEDSRDYKDSRDRDIERDREDDYYRNRDRDRDRDNYRDRDRDQDRENYRDRDRDNYRNRDRDRDRDRDSNNQEESSMKKKKFNWFKYIWYLICCGSNDKNIKYYENIRSSLISEENIIQNYLDIYQLLKLNSIPKKDIFLNMK